MGGMGGMLIVCACTEVKNTRSQPNPMKRGILMLLAKLILKKPLIANGG